MTCGIMDISVVYIDLSIFSNLQLMSVISNINVSIYERFRVSWYTKLWCLLTWTRQSRSLCGEWKVLMASIMHGFLLHYVCFHFSSLFPLIAFVVNMMYLQNIYLSEAIKIPKMIQWKALQLACKLVRYGFTKNSPYS